MFRNIKSSSQMLAVLTVLLGLTSCQSVEKIKSIPLEKIDPITLSVYSNYQVHLGDVLLDYKNVDSIKLPSYLDFNWDKNSGIVKITNSFENPFENLRIYKGKASIDLVLKTILKDKFEFVFDPKGKSYDNLEIKGTFNNWDTQANKLVLENGLYKTQLELMPGIYQYVFVENGKEFTDPNVDEKVANGVGGFNSVLRYGDLNSASEFVYTVEKDSKYFLKSKTDINYLVYHDNNLITQGSLGPNNSFELVDQSKEYDAEFIRVFAYNGNKIANDVLIPIKDGKIVANSSSLDRFDMHGQVMYEVMVDRFNDGDKSNNHPLSQKDVLPIADYHGGDLVGITQKIKDGFFADMGVNSIWLTPIIQNPLDAWGLWDKGIYSKFSGYHGYWPYLTTKIDFRFGTDQEFKELIDVAHKNGISVIFDFVANHVHQDAPLIKQHPDWKTNFRLEDGSKNVALWDSQRLTTWFDDFLPTLDLENKVVAEAISDTAMFWLNKFEIDGLRHDACKHIPLSFWRTLTAKVKKQMLYGEQREIFQIGETYSGPELIGSYVNSGMLNSQFDFNLYDQIVKSFAIESENFSVLKSRLQESLLYYGSHHLMGNVTGNHDKARLISYIDHSVSFDEDTKLAGWTRDIENTTVDSYQKAAQSMVFTAIVPGIPVIYYGDEIGMPGGNDPDNRRMMEFGKLNPEKEELRSIVQKTMKFRRENLPLIYGDTRVLIADENSIVVQRTYLGKSTISFFNKNKASKLIINLDDSISGEFKSLFGKEFNTLDGKLEIQLDKNQFEILYN